MFMARQHVRRQNGDNTKNLEIRNFLPRFDLALVVFYDKHQHTK